MVETLKAYPFEDGFPVYYHGIHAWFAWRPVFTADRGWLWLRTVARQYTSKMHSNGRTTWVVEYWPSRPESQPENGYAVLEANARPAAKDEAHGD